MSPSPRSSRAASDSSNCCESWKSFLSVPETFVWFLSWYHLLCVSNNLELKPVILHGICYILACSPSVLHSICCMFSTSTAHLHDICCMLVRTSNFRLHDICYILVLDPFMLHVMLVDLQKNFAPFVGSWKPIFVQHKNTKTKKMLWSIQTGANKSSKRDGSRNK